MTPVERFGRKTELPGTIALSTRMGRAIPNQQDPDPHPERVAAYVEVCRRRFPAVQLRRRPTGMYNCHGLTFASRRTGIYHEDLSKLVSSILKDDGYRKVGLSNVQEGDVVLYREGEEITHTGVVLQVESDDRILGGGRAARVMSKWGPGGEYVHYAKECPYAGGGGTVEYWTDRDEFPENLS